MSPLFIYSNRLMLATALLSAALIAYQLTIIQLLSLVQWHHYANMVISVALLGFGAAGTVLTLFRKWLVDRSDMVLPLLMIISGFTMISSVILSRSDLARFDSYLLFTDRSQWYALLFNYVLFFLPFFFGALALGIIFIKYIAAIGKFYFADLTGSGAGAAIIAVLAWYFYPEVLPVVFAFMTVAAGLLLLQKNNRKYVITTAAVTTAFIIYHSIYPVDLRLSEYKSLSKTLNLPSSRIVLHKPGPYGLVQVVSADALRYAPGLSLAFTGEVPVKKAVFNNGDWVGTVVSCKKNDSLHLLDYTTMALPYVLKKRNKALILYAGTGMSVSHACSHDARTIDAIEPNPGITKLLLNELAVDNDSLYHQPSVNLHVEEPRTFLSRSQNKYDLIQLPMTGSFGGGAGLYAMKEEYCFTKEAIVQMWNLLEEEGVISISCWMDYPFRNPLKIAATLAEVAEQTGIKQHHSHIAAVRSWGTITFLLMKNPLTAVDTASINKFCHQNFFDPLLLPGLQAEDRMVYNGISDTSFFSYIDQLVYGDKQKLYHDYDFHLRPATDDKPYFSQFIRWKSLPHLKDVFGSQSVSFLEAGWFISIITFIQLFLLAVLLVIFPLFKIGWREKQKGKVLLYFSGLGIGYIFIEIVFIQHFILFFGNPVYAAALVISAMLFCSGLGSYYASLAERSMLFAKKIMLAILLCLMLYTFFLPTLLQQIIGAASWLRFISSIIIIGIPAFFMGMPFPLGLKSISLQHEKTIPWAWAINGCMSVIGGALASLLAVEFGFTVVMLLAVFAYGISLLSSDPGRYA